MVGGKVARRSRRGNGLRFHGNLGLSGGGRGLFGRNYGVGRVGHRLRHRLKTVGWKLFFHKTTAVLGFLKNNKVKFGSFTIKVVLKFYVYHCFVILFTVVISA